MTIEHWCNNSAEIKQKFSKINVSIVYFPHKKFHMEWPGIEAGAWRSQAGD
jgi:hypothetical protein